jgi:geranylgeranyl diphosphate synthase type II
MIDKKTSELLKCCAEIGALIGNASQQEVDALKYYALYTGLAFQIQDDLLDIIADEKKFGKRIGGDLFEGKKTFLLIKAMEVAVDAEDKELLHYVIDNKGVKNMEEVLKVKSIYNKYGVIDEATKKIEEYTSLANEQLVHVKDSESKEMLKWFSDMLLNRTS